MQFVERSPIKHEVLNAFCIVTDSHLDYLLRVTHEWYNHRRGHTVRAHLPPIRDSDSPSTIDFEKQELVSVEELGGHLKSYRVAASLSIRHTIVAGPANKGRCCASHQMRLGGRRPCALRSSQMAVKSGDERRSQLPLHLQNAKPTCG